MYTYIYIYIYILSAVSCLSAGTPNEDEWGFSKGGGYRVYQYKHDNNSDDSDSNRNSNNDDTTCIIMNINRTIVQGLRPSCAP